MTPPNNWTIPHLPVAGYAWEVADPVGAVLLTHALAEYAQRYQDRYHCLIPALNAAGYSVYSYDLRGHGESPGEVSMVDAFVQVDDHLAVRAAVRERCPDLPLYLFAHSAGALFTAGSVMADPQGISGVILSSPMLQAGQDQLALVRHLLPLASKLAPGLAIVPINKAGLSRLPEEVAAYQADERIYQGQVTLLTASTMMQLSQQLWPTYSNWSLPTLVFYGTGDQVSYMDGLPDFVAQLHTPDKALKVFKGGYHELLNDCDREEVLALILDWLWERRPVKDLGSEQMQHNMSRLARLRQRRQGTRSSA